MEKNFHRLICSTWVAVMVNTFWHRQILAACYQLAQSVLKIGSVLAERGGIGGGGWVHPSG